MSSNEQSTDISVKDKKSETEVDSEKRKNSNSTNYIEEEDDEGRLVIDE